MPTYSMHLLRWQIYVLFTAVAVAVTVADDLFSFDLPCDLLQIDVTSTTNEHVQDFVGKYPVIITGALSNSYEKANDPIVSVDTVTTSKVCDETDVCSSLDKPDSATSWIDVKRFRNIFGSKSAKTSSESSIVYSNGRALNTINIGALLDIYNREYNSSNKKELNSKGSSSSSSSSSRTTEYFVFDLDILKCISREGGRATAEAEAERTGTSRTTGTQTAEECLAQRYFPIPGILLETLYPRQLLLQQSTYDVRSSSSSSSRATSDLSNDKNDSVNRGNMRKVYEDVMSPVLSIGSINSGLPFHVHGDAWLGLLPVADDDDETSKSRDANFHTYRRGDAIEREEQEKEESKQSENESEKGNGKETGAKLERGEGGGSKLWLLYPPGYDIDTNRRRATHGAGTAGVAAAAAAAASSSSSSSFSVYSSLNPYIPVVDWIKTVYPELQYNSLLSTEHNSAISSSSSSSASCKLNKELFLRTNSSAASTTTTNSNLLCESKDFTDGNVSVLPFTCIQRPGEVMYVPAGWSHITLNVETKRSETKTEPKTEEYAADTASGDLFRATVGVGGQAVWLAGDRIKLYEPILAEDPFNHDALKGMAVAIRATGREEKSIPKGGGELLSLVQALKYARRAVAVRPRQPDTRILLIELTTAILLLQQQQQQQQQQPLSSPPYKAPLSESREEDKQHSRHYYQAVGSRKELSASSTGEEILWQLIEDVRDTLETLQSYSNHSFAISPNEAKTVVTAEAGIEEVVVVGEEEEVGEPLVVLKEEEEEEEENEKEEEENEKEEEEGGGKDRAKAKERRDNKQDQQSHIMTGMYYSSRRGVAAAYSRVVDLIIPCMQYLHSTVGTTLLTDHLLLDNLDDLIVKLVDGALLLFTASPFSLSNAATRSTGDDELDSSGTGYPGYFDDLKATSTLLAKKLLILKTKGDYIAALSTLQTMMDVSPLLQQHEKEKEKEKERGTGKLDLKDNNSRGSTFIEHMKRYLMDKLEQQNQQR